MKTSSRIGFYALLLGVIALSLFGSLIAADRALSAADRESVALDARAASLAAERELRLMAEALHEMFAPLLPSFPATAAPTDTSPPPNFDAVWIMDVTGGPVWHRSRVALPLDTAELEALGRATAPAASPAIHVAAGRPSQPGLLLLTVPLRHRGDTLGVAIGVIRGDRLIRVVSNPSVRQQRVALLSGTRMVAAVGDDASAGGHSAGAPVTFPGDSLRLYVTHGPSSGTLRTALWVLAATAFAALFVFLWRERRQGISLASRTAELERLYQEVARSNRMKSEFLANVSHELRTPLNAVVGFVEMLREGVYGELTPRQALPVDRIAASATHLRHLVDRLLDIAKIAAGRLEVHPEPLVLRPFVLNVASEMESLVSERGLALSIAVGPTLPRIRTDQTHLRQILINLIGNAVKYTSSGGVQVSARLTGHEAEADTGAEDRGAEVGVPPDPGRVWVALQVSDTGIGIAPADIERIFDEFEQVNAGARTDSARRGTGLGLAISRRLARLLGGELTVVSEVGKGSVFTVWLPVDSANGKPD